MKFTFSPESKPFPGYTIKRGIHRGGFGEVYYALSDAGKEVALKLLQHNLDIELRGIAQCLNLKHPNLITIFDVRTDADGDRWVIMEYVSGKSLEQVLDEHPQGMPMAEVSNWLSGISAGVGFLHDRGIVHRDLKPGNLYRENGVVKIGDIGLSKFITQSRRDAQTQSVGTVYYMAPEVAHGRYGAEVDVYSTGVMLYEMLTGRVPFDGETTGEILMKHLSQKPDLSPLPERLRPVLGRTLEKDPARRPASVAALEQEFRQALHGARAPQELPEEAFLAAQREPSRASAPRLPAPAAAQREWHQDPAVWLKVAAVSILLLAFLAPAVLGYAIKWVFLAGIYGALAYGGYRLAKYFLAPNGGALVTAGPMTHAPPPGGYYPVHPVSFPSRSESRPAPPAMQPVARHIPEPRAHAVITRHDPRRISGRQRMAELTASMAYAVFCAALLTVGMSFVSDSLGADSLGGPAGALDLGRLGFFGITTLLAAWAVLVPAKLWEGRSVEAGAQRLTLLAAGALVGLSAYWLGDVLMVDHHREEYQSALFTSIGSHRLITSTGQPTWVAYPLFFAGLFALRGWSRHADAFRRKRFRLSSLLLTVLVGLILSGVFAFPWLWAATWAAAISSVVQLSAVWVPPRDRAAQTEVNR